MVIGIPTAIALPCVGTGAALLAAIALASILFPIHLIAWGIFRLRYGKGYEKDCIVCNTVHEVRGPGPLGLFALKCSCGKKLGIWNNRGAVAVRPIELPRPWSGRPRNLGARSLLALSLAGAGLVVFWINRDCLSILPSWSKIPSGVLATPNVPETKEPPRRARKGHKRPQSGHPASKPVENAGPKPE